MHENCCMCDISILDSEYITVPNNKYICLSCLNNLNEIRQDISTLENQTSLFPKYSYDSLNPKEIYNYLNQYIVGQDNAKKVLSVAINNHYKRVRLNDPGIQKSNILLVGPTGSGKTYLVKTLAKILDIPLAITSATSLTEAGYVGDDVESLIQKLFSASGGDISRTERGIIFIDEIDKLASSSNEYKRQVGGIGVQQALLALLDGCKVPIPINKAESRSLGSKVDIDTTNILFICGGAFPDAEDIIKKRIIKKCTIGFKSGSEDEGNADENNILMKLENKDLRELGMIPEFLGRLPIIVTLEALSVETLKRILIEPKDSITSQYKKLFAFDSVHLEFEENALEEIAKSAIRKGTGARSLRSIIENLLLNLMFELPFNKSIADVLITKGYVIGTEEPHYLSREMKSINTSSIYRESL